MSTSGLLRIPVECIRNTKEYKREKQETQHEATTMLIAGLKESKNRGFINFVSGLTVPSTMNDMEAIEMKLEELQDEYADASNDKTRRRLQVLINKYQRQHKELSSKMSKGELDYDDITNEWYDDVNKGKL